MPKVSILIPVFNREAFLADCIQSALSQTFTDFEVIVVDNASTDRSWEVALAFTSVDSRVRVFRNEVNIGPVRNWQRCLDEAIGEYAKFLFSDDLMFPDFLSVTLPKFGSKDIAFVSTAAFIGDNIHNTVVSYADANYPEVISTECYVNRLADGDPKIPVSPGTAIFRMIDARKNLLLDIPTTTHHDFAKNGAGPDVLLFALTATSHRFVAFVNQPLVFFRVHDQSLTISSHDNTILEGYRLALAWFLKHHSSPNNWGRLIARIWVSSAKNTLACESPFKLTQRYSGDGSWSDAGRLFYESIKLVFIRMKLHKMHIARFK